MIAYIDAIGKKKDIPYTIIDGPGYYKRIRMNPLWREYMIDNMTIIRSWIQMKKVLFIQDQNPGVAGIVFKLGIDEILDE